MSSIIKTVLFRLDSGGKYGLGHFMRSKTLADALSKKKMACSFAVKNIHSYDAVAPHQLIVINNEDEFISQAESYDCVVVDHYEYTTELFYVLSQLDQPFLVLLDDECNRGPLYADLVINPVNQAKTLPYDDLAPNAELLLGSDYILLGQSFLQSKEINFSDRDDIVITFGGSDVSHLTLPVLKAINKTTLTDAPIVVVTGAGCECINEINQYCLQHGFVHKHNVQNMAELFFQARLAISAAGSTTFELAYCAVPAVFAVVADNQWMSIKEQSENGWCEMVDCRTQNQAEALVDKAEQMNHSHELEAYSHKAQSLIDGQGALRIASHIRALLT